MSFLDPLLSSQAMYNLQLKRWESKKACSPINLLRLICFMNMIELFLKMNGPILFFVILFVQSFYINSQ